MPNGDLHQFYCFYCKYFSKSDKMIAHEKWSAKQEPEEILNPEEYDKKHGTNASKEFPEPISIEVFKTPSENDPPYDTSGMCKFHNVDISESFEGVVCSDWKSKDKDTLDDFRTMLLKKMKFNYLYHWIYKTKLPKKAVIVYKTDTDYLLILEQKIK